MQERYRRGSVWAAKLADLPTIEHEHKGDRPVVLIGNNEGLKHSPNVKVAIIGTRYPKLPTHVTIMLNKRSVIMTETIMTISKSRLVHYIKDLDRLDMIRLDKALALSIGLD